MKQVLVVFCLLLLTGCIQRYSAAPSETDSQLIPSWSSVGAVEYWTEQVFSSPTQYRIVSDKGGSVLQSVTNNSASALYYQNTVDITANPILEWSWWVSNTFSGLDHLQKSGDDYPARLYVLIQDGLSPMDVKALNYVWASSQTGREYWRNPFNPNSIMIPVQTGDSDATTWKIQRRNLKQDFLDYLNLDVTEIHGIAIMSDSDNSGQNATAKFGDIIFSSE